MSSSSSSSLLERLSTSPGVLNSQATKFTLVALAASFTTAAVILGVQGSQRKKRVKQLKDDLRKSIPPPPSFDRTTSSSKPHDHHQLPGVSQHRHRRQLTQQLIHDENFAFDEELVREQMEKSIEFFGEEGVEKLRKSFVIIVGAG
ncbi:hypothetical protein EDD21DRAFT_90103, partial [Dissophora ornata]